MKLIICNQGNKSKVMPLIKSHSPPGVLEMDQCLCRSHEDRQCLQQHILEKCPWLPGIYLSSEERGTSSDFLLKSNVASSVSREACYGFSVVIMR